MLSFKPTFLAFNWVPMSDLLEKEMAVHSSVLACRIPGMGEPGGLPSMWSHRVGHDCSDLAACQTLFLGAPKSLQMVTAAMKLKDTYSLEGKL